MPLKRLSARFVETVTTGKMRAEFRDLHVRGLELRVTREGIKTWAFRYRRMSDGKKRTFTLGRYPTMSVEEARIRAQEERARIARGSDPASGVLERKLAPTFGEITAAWQASHAEANRSARVRKDDSSMLARYILPAIGDMKASDVSRRELSMMLNQAKSATDGRKGHAKDGSHARRLTHRPNRVFELTRAITRWAVAEGLLTNDPTHGMKRPIKREAPRERELSPQEIARFWSGLDELRISEGLRIALKLALVTAQRIGEVVGIQKREVTLEGSAPIWVLPRGRSKNNETTRIPLSPLAVSLIRDALKLSGDSQWLFPSPKGDGPIKAPAASVGIFRGRARLGLDDFRVHDLRRTAATRMAEMGISPHTISLILNHMSARRSTITGKVYVQYSYDREKRIALEAWANRLEEIVVGARGGVVPLRAAI
jgi:integrase